MPLHGVFKAALNGTHYRGTGGFVYVKEEECAYLFPSELTHHKDAAATLQELLEDEKAKEVFYVVEERGGQLHVLAYPRATVLKTMLEEEGEARVEEVSGPSVENEEVASVAAEVD